MKLAGIGVSALAAVIAIAALVLIFSDAGNPNVPQAAAVATRGVTPAAPSPTPLPRTWLAGLHVDGTPSLLSCLDGNANGSLDPGDAALGLAADPGITLTAGACDAPGARADFFAEPIATSCDGATPVRIVLVASAGSDLLQPREGESLGLIDITNALVPRLQTVGARPSVIAATSAVFGANMPQTSMERFLAARLSQELAATPCERAIIFGHSHGGVTATSVGAALEGRFADRLLVVLIDRSAALYDRFATEMPQRAQVINFFQLNEGWHGVPIDQPNVENIDESDERAPIAPSDGGGAPALVSHKTLDDAIAVQAQAVDRALAWSVR